MPDDIAPVIVHGLPDPNRLQLAIPALQARAPTHRMISQAIPCSPNCVELDMRRAQVVQVQRYGLALERASGRQATEVVRPDGWRSVDGRIGQLAEADDVGAGANGGNDGYQSGACCESQKKKGRERERRDEMHRAFRMRGSGASTCCTETGQQVAI